MTILIHRGDAAERPLAPAPRQGALPVRVRGVERRFGERRVLGDLDLDIRPGEFVALLGASGSGKSTLLRLLAGLDEPDGGSVQVPKRIGVVFQDARLLPWRRVWRNAVMGVSRDRAQARAALAEVGLEARLDAWPSTLSGGEAQRVALARALVREPRLLLLDEPFAALDALTRLRMQSLVLSLWRQHGPAVLLVTHDVDEALQMADRVLVMRNGSIALDEAIATQAHYGVEFEGLIGARTIFDRSLSADVSERVNNDTPDVLTVSGRLVRERPEIVQTVLQQLLRARDWARTHRAEVVQLMAQEFKTSEALVEASWGDDLTSSLDLDLAPLKIEAVRSQHDFLLEHGFIDRAFDVDEWIDGAPLSQAEARHAAALGAKTRAR